MLKILSFLFLSLFFLQGIYAAEVTITVDVEKELAFFKYLISFEDDEELASFSFEKPQESKVTLSENPLGEKLRYSTAGDYFIFKPEGTKGKEFSIEFESLEGPKELEREQSFSNYVNFNFPVSNLTYTLQFTENFGEVQEVFPRTHQVLDDGSYFWQIENPDTDTFFLINFPRSEKGFFGDFASPFIWGLGIGLFLLLLVLLGLFFFRRNRKKEGKKKEKKLKTTKKEESEEKEDSDSQKQGDEFSTQSFDEIVEKYLTETEAEVVRVIKENKGISQYDILNFLPSMTKSNLSKIITKLHGRKFLSRIKVGKVNKIYLGERLESDED